MPKVEKECPKIVKVVCFSLFGCFDYDICFDYDTVTKLGLPVCRMPDVQAPCSRKK